MEKEIPTHLPFSQLLEELYLYAHKLIGTPTPKKYHTNPKKQVWESHHYIGI